jgi:hypothetical protein
MRALANMSAGFRIGADLGGSKIAAVAFGIDSGVRGAVRP